MKKSKARHPSFIYPCGMRFWVRVRKNKLEYTTDNPEGDYFWPGEWNIFDTITRCKRFVEGKYEFPRCPVDICGVPRTAGGRHIEDVDVDRSVLKRILKKLELM